MSFRDLSQLSDVSSTSGMSRSSSRQYTQPGTSQNDSKNVPKDKHVVNQMDRTVSLFMTYEESASEYVKAKLILQCIQEAVSDETLPKETTVKLNRLLTLHEVNKYMHLPSIERNTQMEELSLLGIIDLPKPNLTSEEKLDVKCRIETMLRDKIHNFMLRYATLPGVTKETPKCTEARARHIFSDHEQSQVAQWKEKLDNLFSQYESSILRSRRLLNRWKELKYKDVGTIYCRKAENLLLQAQVAELQARITRLSCVTRMFHETPVTIKAFTIINNSMDEKLSAITNEIQQKEKLKKSYDDLRDTEYSDVLKEYSQLCNSIKKKKHLLNSLNCS